MIRIGKAALVVVSLLAGGCNLADPVAGGPPPSRVSDGGDRSRDGEPRGSDARAPDSGGFDANESGVPTGEGAIELAPQVIGISKDETAEIDVAGVEGSDRRIDEGELVWESSAPDVATVEAGGVVGQAIGSSRITATLPGVASGAAMVEVTSTGRKIGSVTIYDAETPGPGRVAFLSPGQQRSLGAQVRDAGGDEIDFPVKWSSTDTEVVAVDPDGTIEGGERSHAVVSATAGHVVDSDPWFVTYSGDDYYFYAGLDRIFDVDAGSEPYTARLSPSEEPVPANEDGDRRALRPGGIEFSSRDSSVMSVDADGRLTAEGRGRTVIEATDSMGRNSSFPVYVETFYEYSHRGD